MDADYLKYKYVLICITNFTYHGFKSKFVNLEVSFLNHSTQRPSWTTLATNFPLSWQILLFLTVRASLRENGGTMLRTRCFQSLNLPRVKFWLAVPTFLNETSWKPLKMPIVDFESISRGTTAKQRGSLLRQWCQLILENTEDHEPIFPPPPTLFINYR